MLGVSQSQSSNAEANKAVGASMQSSHDAHALNRITATAFDLKRERKFAESEVEFKKALELVPSADSTRVYEISAALLQIYAETKQDEKLRSFLADTQFVSFYTSRRGAQYSSAIINTWLKQEFYSEARELAAQLLPNLEWDKPLPKSNASSPGYRSCGIARASERVPSYNLRIWSATCNENGKPEEAEKLFDECIESAAKAGKEQTEQYVLINSLAAIQSIMLEHFDKVEAYFESAFAAGCHLHKPPFWELFSAAQRLLPKNLDLASKFFIRLFPYSQDKVYEVSLKLDLARELAKHNQEVRAKQLAVEVDQVIRKSIKNEFVEAAYSKHINAQLLAAPVGASETLLIDRLIWFPRATSYENGIREIDDWSVLTALGWNASKVGDLQQEEKILDMKLKLLNDSETQSMVRKVHIYKKLAQLARIGEPVRETIAKDYEEKALAMNKELKENRGCWVP